MSNMGKTALRKVAGREVVCRELTVGQVRLLLAKECKKDLANISLMEDMLLEDIEVFTSLTQDEVDAMYPSELADVVAGCKEANPHFFAMLAKLEAQRRAA